MAIVRGFESQSVPDLAASCAQARATAAGINEFIDLRSPFLSQFGTGVKGGNGMVASNSGDNAAAPQASTKQVEVVPTPSLTIQTRRTARLQSLAAEAEAEAAIEATRRSKTRVSVESTPPLPRRTRRTARIQTEEVEEASKRQKRQRRR